ncbi:hypothetical protein JAAARDRAFT_28206 [Jaapia argillacea MUCL 33604]|uniref:Uncharacterized protein n=1 Tax=Jaapia argillacea MUCL 33604 TaxID=933084 RepID=A0A067QM24_9AGAM|nr:hypothetical protein JAAARDRAFT_28206 [Jaapia argillacea MUCL 33604]
MRRIVSAFSRRSEKNNSGASPEQNQHQSQSLFHRSPSKPSRHPPNGLIAISTHPLPELQPSSRAEGSSESSSSGSASVRTPEDDGAGTAHDVPKKALMGWLTRKKSAPPQRSTPSSIQQWSTLPHSPQRQPVAQQPTRQVSYDHHDSDDDTSSDSSDESGGPLFTPRHTGVKIASAATVSQSKSRLQHSISQRLIPVSTPPPCLHLPSGPLFPRSSNPSRKIDFPETTETLMYRNHLRRRLQDPSITASELQSIVPFASKSTPPPKGRDRAQLPYASVAVPDPKRVERHSEGLRKWIDRPCFEDRMVLWEPDQSGADLRWRRVPGNGKGLGVAAIEYSVGLECLAGFEFGEGPADSLFSPYPSPLADELTMSSSASSSSSQLSSQMAHHIRSEPPLPSPLRIQIDPSPLISISLSPDSSPLTPPTHASPFIPDKTSLTVPVPQRRAKQGVHFAEPEKDSDDDATDRIPLGYAMRVKKQREEKARFLRDEKERRLLEDERKKQEEERRKHEAERREWEREKKAWEKEKKAIEEERMKIAYKEELAASRARRERTRNVDSGTDELGRMEEKHTRPAYDSSRPSTGRQGSLPVPSNTSSPATGSPSSSRPQSTSGPRSRPTSIHSAAASSEDVRMKDRGRKSRRQSMASETGSHVSLAPSTYPRHSIPPMVPPMPMMPMMPVAGYNTGMPTLAMDNMPLLPPSAPFMQGGGQRSRSRSGSTNNSKRDSSISSRSSSNSRPQNVISSSQSAERVALPSNRRQTMTSQSGHRRSSSGSDEPSRSANGSLSSASRSYSGPEVDRRYSSLRGTTMLPPSASQSQRPTMYSSVSWGGPWGAYPVASVPMTPMTPTGFMGTPMPMLPPGMAYGPMPQPVNPRQSVIF